MNRITQIEQADSSVVFARSHYQYDNVGREVARWRDEEGGKGERFGYNTNSQLTSAIYKADNVSTGNPSNWASRRDYTYTPDLLNWVSVNDNGHPAPFSANGLNQYTNINGSAAQYDERFNLSQFGGMQYNYDAPSHLVAVAGNGHSASFTYDGLGRCVRRTIDNVPRLFTYDGWSAIMEWDGGGSWTAINIYGAKTDEILGRYDAARGAMIYKQDNQGNVVFLLDANSQIIERYSYDAYGRPTITDRWGNPHYEAQSHYASWYGNHFMYTGREWLWELSLYDYRHRFYYPDIGRFLQSDPTGFDAGDMNLFRYCGDDPVDRSDPTGLLDRDWNAVVRAIDQAALTSFFEDEARAQTLTMAPVSATTRPATRGGGVEGKHNFKTWQAAGLEGGYKAYAKVDKSGLGGPDNPEYGGLIVSQKSAGRTEWNYTGPFKGKQGEVDDKYRKLHKANYLDVNAMVAPDGWTKRGWYYAHPVIGNTIPPDDKAVARDHHWVAVGLAPPPKKPGYHPSEPAIEYYPPR